MLVVTRASLLIARTSRTKLLVFVASASFLICFCSTCVLEKVFEGASNASRFPITPRKVAALCVSLQRSAHLVLSVGKRF